ncbi:MAG: hypothetical protein IV092_17110 [Burkholderiaceae bacterium]|nr:hypothetical protein [Burkholderiaceae bacterium]
MSWSISSAIYGGTNGSNDSVAVSVVDALYATMGGDPDPGVAKAFAAVLSETSGVGPDMLFACQENRSIQFPQGIV